MSHLRFQAISPLPTPPCWASSFGSPSLTPTFPAQPATIEHNLGYVMRKLRYFAALQQIHAEKDIPERPLKRKRSNEYDHELPEPKRVRQDPSEPIAVPAPVSVARISAPQIASSASVTPPSARSWSGPPTSPTPPAVLAAHLRQQGGWGPNCDPIDFALFPEAYPESYGNEY